MTKNTAQIAEKIIEEINRIRVFDKPAKDKDIHKLFNDGVISGLQKAYLILTKEYPNE